MYASNAPLTQLALVNAGRCLLRSTQVQWQAGTQAAALLQASVTNVW